jgi:RNA polymerase sigma-70 factor (ECF subfamily)
MTGDDRLAEDLLQETYYRFLRSTARFESDDHRRQYLFRIATNLIHDQRRRPAVETLKDGDAGPARMDPPLAERVAQRIDLSRALARLKPRDRSLLWLAYAQGCSHEEIAQATGLKAASLKAMLSRARHRLAAALKDFGGRR